MIVLARMQRPLESKEMGYSQSKSLVLVWRRLRKLQKQKMLCDGKDCKSNLKQMACRLLKRLVLLQRLK